MSDITLSFSDQSIPVTFDDGVQMDIDFPAPVAMTLDFSAVVVAEGGDMEKSVYDPTAVEADAFDLSNHTGSMTANTVSLDGGLL